MLVLTRKCGEEIRIGDDIIIKVVAVRGSHVKVGIEAAHRHHILRGELYDRDELPSGAPAQERVLCSADCE